MQFASKTGCTSVEKDTGVASLLGAETPVVTIFGKSWLLHVHEVLRVSPDDNLEIIADTCGYLKDRGREVIYDAEHFFDGFAANPGYALDTLAAAVAGAWIGDRSMLLISGAPAANWWVMVGYMVLGLGALYISSRHLPDVQQRRGPGLVFVGSLFGVVPFLLFSVAFPSFLDTERFLFYGVAPLVLVPITFAYAIVRYQLLDIRVILRKSLLYTVTTALVTAVYALGIASFNLLRFLSDRYDIFLGTFIYDPADRPHRAVLDDVARALVGRLYGRVSPEAAFDEVPAEYREGIDGLVVHAPRRPEGQPRQGFP